MKYALNRSRHLSIDGVQTSVNRPHIPPNPKPDAQAPKAASNHRQRPKQVVAQSKAPQSKRQWLPHWAKLILAFPLVLILGFSMQSLIIGQLLIIAYGIVAFVRRIPSRATFSMALIAMIGTIILLIGRTNPGLAQNFATYTFLLLVAGVLTLSRELKKEGGQIYSSKYTNVRK